MAATRRTVVRVLCPSCGRERVDILGRVAPAIREGHERYDIAECRSCGLSFTLPSPSAAELRAFYERDGLYDAVYGTEDHDWQRRQHALDLRRIAVTREGRLGRLLDVGCSYGLLLEVARDAGWDAYGVEPGAAAVEAARRRVGKNHVYDGTFLDLPDSAGPFDAISMSHVWEHFVDYRSVLAKVARMLTRGGVLAIQAPNRRALMTRWRGLDYRPVEHPFYWTYSAVFAELRKVGMRPRVAPALWPPRPATREQTFKEVALAAERLTAPLMNYGIKSTMEVHGIKR